MISDARSLSKDAVAEIAAYLGAPDPDAPLVICCQVAERGKPPAALDKLVKAVGTVTQVAIARKELEPWVVKRAKDAGVDLGIPSARALVETLGEEPGALVAAIQQLAGAFAGQKVTPAIVAEQFRGLGEQKVWDLCDRAFGKDLPGAIRSLRSLEEGRDDPLMVLGGDLDPAPRPDPGPRAARPARPRTRSRRPAGLRFDWQARRYQQQARNFSMEQLAGAPRAHHRGRPRAEVGSDRGRRDAGADRRDRGGAATPV